MFNYRSLDEVIQLAEERKEPPFLLVLDGIEDPHNFGAILRTAEAAGVHAVIIRKARQVPVTSTVIKTSTGAAEVVPVIRVPNIAEAVRELQDELIPVFAVEIDGKALYNTRDYKGPAAFVIGSEGNGVSRLVKERCTEIVRLPMRGRINSLNASVATGIVLYEVLRQRGGE